MITGRVIIPDGALIPTRNRAAHPELYSDKRHQSGAAVQILSGIEGRLHHVGEPIAGSIHDVRTFRQTGPAAALTEHMTNNLVIADLDYSGEPVVTPVSKPLKGKLSPAQIKANKRLSGIRSAVECRIAHLKTGRRWPPDSVDHCENSPSASQQSPHSNYTDSTGPLLNNAPACETPTFTTFKLNHFASSAPAAAGIHATTQRRPNFISGAVTENKQEKSANKAAGAAAPATPQHPLPAVGLPSYGVTPFTHNAYTHTTSRGARSDQGQPADGLDFKYFDEH